jgi:hypothetical protein
MLKSRITVQGNKMVSLKGSPMTSRSANIRAAKKDSAANILGSSYTTPMAGSNTSVMTFGGPAFNTTFLGIIP